MNGEQFLRYAENLFSDKYEVDPREISDGELLDFIGDMSNLDLEEAANYMFAKKRVQETEVPFLAVGPSDLSDQNVGKTTTCKDCGKEHSINNATDTKTGKPSSMLQFYTCPETAKSYLYGINGKKLK